MSESKEEAVDPDSGVELTDEQHYRLLASGKRRKAMSSLDGTQNPTDLETLADSVVDDGEKTTVVKVDLHHVHLPLMDALGVLEYDHDSHEVTTYRRPRRPVRSS